MARLPLCNRGMSLTLAHWQVIKLHVRTVSLRLEVGTNGGEDEVTDPKDAPRGGGASYSFPSFAHCLGVELRMRSAKMFKDLLRFPPVAL